LCNNSVQFIIKRDPKQKFHFASLQSDIAISFLKKHAVELLDTDSILLITKNNISTKSSAALRITRSLFGLWPIFSLFLLIPKFLRDSIYDYIAKRRYKWFGKNDTCTLPDLKNKGRFL